MDYGANERKNEQKNVYTLCVLCNEMCQQSNVVNRKEKESAILARACVCVFMYAWSLNACVCARVFFFSSFVHFFQFVQESVLLLLLLFTVGCFLPQSLCISTVLWQNYREYVVFVPCNDILRCVLQFTVCIARRCCVVSLVIRIMLCSVHNTLLSVSLAIYHFNSCV